MDEVLTLEISTGGTQKPIFTSPYEKLGDPNPSITINPSEVVEDIVRLRVERLICKFNGIHAS